MIKLYAEQKHRAYPLCDQTLCPTCKGGAMPQVCLLFTAISQSCRTKHHRLQRAFETLIMQKFVIKNFFKWQNLCALLKQSIRSCTALCSIFGCGICVCALKRLELSLQNLQLRFKLLRFRLRNSHLRFKLKNFGCRICACALTLKNFGCRICTCALS